MTVALTLIFREREPWFTRPDTAIADSRPRSEAFAVNVGGVTWQVVGAIAAVVARVDRRNDPGKSVTG